MVLVVVLTVEEANMRLSLRLRGRRRRRRVRRYLYVVVLCGWKKDTNTSKRVIRRFRGELCLILGMRTRRGRTRGPWWMKMNMNENMRMAIKRG